ncbi:hypothetical protein ACNKHR_25080 [Shigella flexneri]
MRADKVVRLPQNWGVMWLFWVTSRGPIRVSTFKEGKVFPQYRGINSCSTPTWVKVKATKKKSVSTTKACLLTSCLVTSCCWTMVASS